MSISELWLESIERASWQGGLALLLAWILCRFLRFPARIKCWIWRLAYLKLILSAVWITPIALPVWQAPEISQVSSVPVPSFTTLQVAMPTISYITEPMPMPNTVKVAHEPIWPLILMGLWMAGIGLLAGRITIHALHALRIRRRAKPISAENITEICDNLSWKLGLKSAPRILVSSEISSPVVIGLLRPAILLPSSAGDFSNAMLFSAIAHELTHIARRDLLWNLYAAVIETLFFFHPMVWLARFESRLTQEMACDQSALRMAGATPAKYGQMLVDVVCANFTPSVLSAGVIESRKTLERRLIAMKSLMNWKPRRIAAAAFMLVLIGFIALPQWRLVARGQTQTTNPPPGMFHPPGAPPGVFVPIPGGDGNSATRPAVPKSLQPGTASNSAPQSIKPLSLYAMTDGIITHTMLGTDVKKGDVIIQFDDRRQILALDEAKAEVQLEEKSLADLTALHVVGGNTNNVVEAQKLKTKMAEDEASLRQLDLEDTRVVAPGDGSVSEAPGALIGQYITKGTAVCLFTPKVDSNATSPARSDVEIRMQEARQAELDRLNSPAARGASAQKTNAPPGMFHPPGSPPGVFVPLPSDGGNATTQPAARGGPAQNTNAPPVPPGMFHPPGSPPGVLVPIPGSNDNN